MHLRDTHEYAQALYTTGTEVMLLKKYSKDSLQNMQLFTRKIISYKNLF